MIMKYATETKIINILTGVMLGVSLFVVSLAVLGAVSYFMVGA